MDGESELVGSVVQSRCSVRVSRSSKTERNKEACSRVVFKQFIPVLLLGLGHTWIKKLLLLCASEFRGSPAKWFQERRSVGGGGGVFPQLSVSQFSSPVNHLKQ